jgi:phasin
MNVMTEATTATKATTAKPAAPPFGLPKYEIPKMEVPAEFREMTDMGLGHARDAYAKAKVASEEAADLLQNTYTTIATSATNYNLKIIEIARGNTKAALDYANALLGVKALSEFVELSSAHACKQFDIVSAQNKELLALAQNFAAEAAEPIRTGISKVFNKAA